MAAGLWGELGASVREPSPLTNVIEILCMWSLGAALPYTFGLFAKSRRQGWIIFSVMMTLFIGFLSLNYAAETNGNPALNRLGIDASQGSMEGKEVRFGSPNPPCSPR